MTTRTVSFLVALGLVGISSYFCQIMDLLFEWIFARHFGFSLSYVSFLGIALAKTDGKWKLCKAKFSPIIQTNVIVDMSRQVEDRDKKGLQMQCSKNGIEILIAVILCFLNYQTILSVISNPGRTGGEILFASTIVGILLQTLLSLVISIFVYQRVMKQLGGYVKQKRKMLIAGCQMEELDMLPLSQLPYEKPTKTEKALYYSFYIPYLIASNKMEELYTVATEVKQLLYSMEYYVQNTLLYYWMIYYYSRYVPNKADADYFYNYVQKTIESDPDANAKRVLAQYEYASGNIEKARMHLAEGFRALDKFSVGAERELERRLLLEQKEYIG